MRKCNAYVNVPNASYPCSNVVTFHAHNDDTYDAEHGHHNLCDVHVITYIREWIDARIPFNVTPI